MKGETAPCAFLQDGIGQTGASQLRSFPSGLGLVLVKDSDDSFGGGQQGAVLDRFRDGAVSEMFAAAITD
jgi:hypothetical protein